ncbi:MAG TPA: ABC transporter permease [Nitrososphaerales archaeon]|nr:ABC transporter permease [Nitrososphaerales archaeon]
MAEIKFALYLARKNPLVLVGTAIAIISVVVAVFSGFIVNPNLWKFQHLASRLCWNNPAINWHIGNIHVCPGNVVYPLGTDSFGRDLLKMMVLALPIDLEISFAIVFSAVAIGICLGAVAAYAGGLLDEAILRVTDIFFAFPGLVLAIVILAVFGRTLPNLTIAVLIVWWPIYVRLVRSQILSEKEKPYAEALRAVGAGRLRILFRHILPNSIYPVLVQLTLDIGGVILTFSSLMFLGFSPNQLLPELGNLVSSGIDNVATAPWLIIFPGLTILVVALGFNLLGDGIRDILDPRLRR